MVENLLLFIVVGVVLYYAYKNKKRKEQQIGEDLDCFIEKGDWDSVCRILRKQLIIWGALLVAIVSVLVYEIVMFDKRPYTKMWVGAIVLWRLYKLADMYFTSRHNRSVVVEEKESVDYYDETDKA